MALLDKNRVHGLSEAEASGAKKTIACQKYW